jgi:cytochrome c oxidase cbb3-type subunit 3
MTRLVAAALLLACGLSGCEREERAFRPNPVATETEEKIALSSLSAGPAPPTIVTSGKGREYENNAYHMSQGKKLYAWFNCVGCHAHGGGGSGPALMDDAWIYGAAIENIVQTVKEGRPNGMPSFRGKIPEDQVWQIAAYVRSMGRYVPKAAAPGRNDDMHAKPSENRQPRVAPTQGGFVPPSAQMPQ